MEIEEYGEAREYLSEALALYQELGHPTRIPNAMLNLAVCDNYVGDYELATRISLETLEMVRAIKHQDLIAATLTNLAQAYIQAKEPRKAAEALLECFQIWRNLASTTNIAEGLMDLAMVAVAQGRAEEAAWLSGAEEGLREAAGSVRSRVIRRRAKILEDLRATLEPKALAHLRSAGRKADLPRCLQYAEGVATALTQRCFIA
jgi:tetratricopeptide (TPR) repeat protein